MKAGLDSVLKIFIYIHTIINLFTLTTTLLASLFYFDIAFNVLKRSWLGSCYTMLVTNIEMINTVIHVILERLVLCGFNSD